MALYFYQAFSKKGKKVSGYLDAPSVQGVKDQLTRQALYPIKIVTATQEARQGFFQRWFGRGVSTKEKILFTKQLAVLLKSGVPLLQALELLIEQFEGRMRSVLITIKDEVKEGIAFNKALSAFPKIFDNIYVQLVRAGEAGGNLEVILERLVTFMEKRQAIRARIKSALMYPMIQMIVAVLVIAVMLIFVVPTMAENFAGQGQELPGTTLFLLAISDFVSSYYIFIGVGIIILVMLFKYWKSTPSGSLLIDRIKLKLPLIKYFTQMNAVVQFSYTLGMLLEGGVNLSESLDIVVKIINNRVLADALNKARDKIIKQGKIAQYLKQTKIFPPIAIYLIQTGEETGKLDVMLLTVAQNYEEDLSELADTLSTALGPILLIFMAVVVGFIVISIASPLFKMGELAGI